MLWQAGTVPLEPPGKPIRVGIFTLEAIAGIHICHLESVEELRKEEVRPSSMNILSKKYH